MRIGMTENGVLRFRDIPLNFTASYDVVVVGLGSAGTEAALVSAALGLKTLGIEKANAMGGQSTVGGVHFKMKYPFSKQPNPANVLKNHHLNSRIGTMDIPDREFLFECEADESKLDIAYETIAIGVCMEENTVKGVRICRNGLFRDIAAKIVIDCTGNCSVSRMAGCEVKVGREFDHGQAAVSKVLVFQIPGGYRPSYGFFRDNPICSTMEYSQMVLKLSAHALGMRTPRRSRVVMEASILGAREEGHVVTEEVVSLHHCLFGKPVDNPIFYAYTPLDLCRVDEDWAFENEDVQNWKVLCGLHNFAYPSSLPYETLLPKGVNALLVPSKHFGVAHDAGGGIRMIREMRKTGYTAACAAKLAVELNVPLKQVPYDRLRKMLDAGGITAPAKRRFVTYYSGSALNPFSDEEAIEALRHDIVPAGSWIHRPRTGIGEKAAFAYFTFWDRSMKSSPAERKALTDRLCREMLSAGRYTGNFAIALGIMNDPRCCDVLRNIIEQPGNSNPNGWDPLIRNAYPNRIKALCLLGRFYDRESMPVMRDIVLDNARNFTKDLEVPQNERGSKFTGYCMFNGSREQYQFAALSFSLFSLTSFLKKYPDPLLQESLLTWSKKPFTLIAGRYRYDCAPMLKQIVTRNG